MFADELDAAEKRVLNIRRSRNHTLSEFRAATRSDEDDLGEDEAVADVDAVENRRRHRELMFHPEMYRLRSTRK